MLYDSAVRSVSTLLAQWRLVVRSFENLLSDFDLGEPHDWQWHDPNPPGDSLFPKQKAFAKNSLLQRARAEVTRLVGELTKVEKEQFGPIPAGKTLLEVAIDYITTQVFQVSLGVLAAPTSVAAHGVETDFDEAFDVAGGNVGFPLAPPGGPNPNNFPAVDTVLGVQLCRERMDDLERFIVRQLADFAEAVSSLGPGLNLQGIRAGIEDIGAYPILTTETPRGGYSGGYGGGGAPATLAPAGTPSLLRVVDGALRDVLGRSPRVADTKSFVSALNQSFDLTTVEGRTVVAYTPRSFSGQTELGGGVTGAQASLYARASVSLDKALPLLDGLYALKPDADEQEMEATRAIVRDEFTEVVTELKAEGGPTTARVDQLLLQLFGTVDGTVRVDTPEGHFGDVAGQFGFGDDRFVNTLDEESNASNFIAVFDYANQVRLGWVEFRDQYYGKDLGTRFVLLSRALSVAAESVDEVCAALDSVFVGPAERQVASFAVPGSDRPILVSELFDWVRSFTTADAPRLIQDGGRRGVAAIQPTAIQLERLVRQLITAIPSDPGLPKGMQHPRVRFPLQELRGYLDQIQLLADDVRKPLRNSKP
jgi:hypothetical protein